jgi:DNA-binding protein H-NS
LVFVTIKLNSPGYSIQITQRRMTMTAEQQAVLRSIRQLVDFWQISAHELASDTPVQRSVQLPLAPKGPKYRHPITHETWDGEGVQPQWLKDALIKEGYLVDELRLSSSEAGAAAPTC